VRVRLDDVADDVVDRVQVVPGLLGGALCGLDDVEVDAVGPEVLTAHERDHPRRGAAARVAVRLA
jgi:hypothetical protein